MAYLELENLTKHYGPVKALDGVDLDVRRGEFLTLLGPSGSGKTTLLMIVAGFVIPDQGRVRLDGQDLTRVPPYSRGLGMVFQHYALFPHMSVFDNVAFALRMRKTAAGEVRRAVTETLAMVHLEGMQDRLPSQLSGGQQQRVSLARALVYRPRLLLMDEPLGALDKKLREMMQIELKHIQQQVGITVLSVTHDQEEALTLSDRVAVMNHGHLEQIGSADQLYEAPENRFVADFIGETNFLDVRVDSTDNGWMTVSSPSISEFRIPNRPGLAGLESIQLSIRPEKIVFVAESSELECTAAAVVREVVYMGDTTRFYVRLSRGEELVVKQHNRYGVQLPVKDDQVVIGWSPANCVGLKP
jgi:spermidine/putrescine ABC transporter ATP-binding subunit